LSVFIRVENLIQRITSKTEILGSENKGDDHISKDNPYPDYPSDWDSDDIWDHGLPEPTHAYHLEDC
jgi:hypothetical protein